METIRQTAYNFKAVEHRIEYTATKKQVRYYNDSKGTPIAVPIAAAAMMFS